MTSPQTDAAPLNMALTELRLPTIKALWPRFAEQADKEGWPAARLLSALLEHELAERDRRRIERHLAQARLLPGKTLETFDFTAVPMLSKAHVSAITAGDSWISKGSNILLLRLKFQVQHRNPAGDRMLRWTDEASTSTVRNVA